MRPEELLLLLPVGCAAKNTANTAQIQYIDCHIIYIYIYMMICNVYIIIDDCHG